MWHKGILDFMSSSAAVMGEAWSVHAHAAACGNLSAAPSISRSLSSARPKNMSQMLLDSNHVLQKLLYPVTYQCLHSAKVSHLAILTWHMYIYLSFFDSVSFLHCFISTIWSDFFPAFLHTNFIMLIYLTDLGNLKCSEAKVVQICQHSSQNILESPSFESALHLFPLGCVLI